MKTTRKAFIGTTDSSGVCFWAGGERGGDEGVRGRHGRYLHKTWRNRGKNEVCPGAWSHGFRGLFGGVGQALKRDKFVTEEMA